MPREQITALVADFTTALNKIAEDETNGSIQDAITDFTTTVTSNADTLCDEIEDIESGEEDDVEDLADESEEVTEAEKATKSE